MAVTAVAASKAGLRPRRMAPRVRAVSMAITAVAASKVGDDGHHVPMVRCVVSMAITAVAASKGALARGRCFCGDGVHGDNRRGCIKGRVRSRPMRSGSTVSMAITAVAASKESRSREAALHQ